MPEEFDPEWEYREDDPELVEAAGFAQLGIEERRLKRTGAVSGFRFGKGDPDRIDFHLAPERPIERPILDSKVCPTCNNLFTPYRSSQIHCSKACYIRPGRKRELPESLPCEACGLPFRPRCSIQRFCGHYCAGSQAPGRPFVVEGERAAILTQMWQEGRTITDIAEAMGCSEITVKRARRRLGLAPRPLGNHSRVKR